MWDQITTQISQVTGESFAQCDRRSVSGGCINSGYALSNGQRSVFVKLNQAARLAMFEAEAAGLEDMIATQTIRVPRPLCWGIAAESAYLVLEWLELGRAGSAAWDSMGRQLAALHRAIATPTHHASNTPQPALMQPDNKQAFGWRMNNTIGSTPQINSWTADWTSFWASHRIGYQVSLATRRGGQFPRQAQLFAAIPKILAGHQPQPSLVHGDLWSGNAAVTTAGEPVIFDPAAYYGDREVDLAMTELFGGFPTAFYQGYNAVFPLAAGYQQRKTLYNLYHILNHFNLFGGSYDTQANRMIEQLLASR
jgi:fructosamine-3-kinase